MSAVYGSSKHHYIGLIVLSQTGDATISVILLWLLNHPFMVIFYPLTKGLHHDVDYNT